jgi:peptidyl-prolyl cis-trans isomerase A (cyclophilin A)
MKRPLVLLAALSLIAGCGEAPPARPPAESNAATPRQPAPVPAVARVRIETGAGAIVIELDGRRAPLTTGNFLAYVDQHKFDGTTFYRAARTEGAAAGRGFVQGGIRRDYRRMLAPIAHEPTSATGLRHREGTVSMARGETGAMGNFFITTAAMPSMDAHGGEQGYAAFGRVVEGMDVVRRILAGPTVANAGAGAMRGQMLVTPVPIVRATRID